jgi:hypothetical protein
LQCYDEDVTNNNLLGTGIINVTQIDRGLFKKEREVLINISKKDTEINTGKIFLIANIFPELNKSPLKETRFRSLSPAYSPITNTFTSNN